MTDTPKEDIAKANTPKVIGVTGLRHANKTLYDDEIVAELKFPRSITTFSKMKTDPIIAGSFLLIQQFVRSVKPKIEAKGKLAATDSAKKKAEIVSDALFKDMTRSFDQVLTEIITFVENGFSFHEPTFKIKKGNVVWKDFPTRHASTIKGFKWDRSGDITHVIQWAPNPNLVSGTGSLSGTDIEIPYDRLLHFRTNSERNNPVGKSILKNAHRAWSYKSKLEELEAIGVEREMNGLPYMRIPAEYFNADAEESPELYATLQEFIRIGTNARNNEQACIIMPSDRDENNNPLFEFELIASKGTRSLDTSKIIERYDYRIAQSMLADFLLMGSGSTGSFALSDNKVGTFVRSLEAYLEVVSEQFNRRAIPELYRRNGWSEEDLCELVFEPIGNETLEHLGKFLDNTKNFITPDKSLENAVRKRANLPERDESELYIDTPTATHQAASQRIGMQASADKTASSTSSVEDTSTTVEDINKQFNNLEDEEDAS